jgi:hypothetical protein
MGEATATLKVPPEWVRHARQAVVDEIRIQAGYIGDDDVATRDYVADGSREGMDLLKVDRVGFEDIFRWSLETSDTISWSALRRPTTSRVPTRAGSRIKP